MGSLDSAIYLVGASVAFNAFTSNDVWILVISLADVMLICTALGGMKTVISDFYYYY